MYKTLKKLNISLTIPEEFKTVDDTGDFLWLRQHLKSGIARGAGNNNILVYSLPLNDQTMSSNNIISIPNTQSCHGEINDGIAEFNLNEITASFQNQIPLNSVVSYYETEEDAFKGTNTLISPYLNSTPYNQTLYVKTISNNQCYALSTVNLEIAESPVFSKNKNMIYCLNNFPATISVDSGLLNGVGNDPSFEWHFNNMLIATTPSIDINKIGVYKVTVTFNNSCSETNDLVISQSNLATIESIDIQQATENNTVTIKVLGEGDYQFALDTPIYQNENIFTNVKPGFHTVSVLDINGCGIVKKEISVLGFPRFFTPNNDGVHDTWKPYGVNAQFNADIDIKIFDRYGKFLKQINPLEKGWNGIFNGQLLNSDDYWYVIKLSDGTEYRGHFALKK